MVRLIFRGALGVLSAALVTACLGGQTGQPSSAHCDETGLPPSDAWAQTTVGAAVEAFEGLHRGRLRWQQEPRFAETQTPVELADTLQLTVHYEGVDGVKNSCSGQLKVPVMVALNSSASGIDETQVAELELAPASRTATLRYQGDRFSLVATLAEVGQGTAASGSLDALDANLPGASASLSEALE